MGTELSREGGVWREQFFGAMQAWAQGGQADSGQFEQGAEFLKCYLERCPDCADDVANLARNACLVGQRSMPPGALGAYLRVARDARLLDPATVDRYVVMLLCHAQALLGDRQRIDGLKTLEQCEQLLGQLDHDDPILEWSRAKLAHLEGGLWQLDLERVRAFQSYSRALRVARELLDDSDAFSVAWVEANFGWMGSGVRIEDFAPIAMMELQRLYTDAAVGVARNVPADESASSKGQVARVACEAIEQYGISPDLAPLVLADILAPLAPNDAHILASRLLEFLDAQISEAANEELPGGLTYEPAVEVARRAVQMRHDQLKNRAKPWAVAALLGQARASRYAGNVDDAHRLFIEAAQTAINHRQGLPQAVALSCLLEFEDEQQTTELDDLIAAFVTAYGGAVEVQPELFEQPEIRVLIEGGAAATAQWAMKALAKRNDRATRERASVLLDLLRKPDPPAGAALLQLVRKSDQPSAPDDEDGGDDAVTRIIAALKRHPSTVVLVTQSLRHGMAFLVVTADGIGAVEHAGPEYLDGLAALEAAVQVPLWAKLAGATQGDPARVEQAGKRAFERLPSKVRSAISQSVTVLVAPDFRGAHPIQPFELMHDGARFLGLSKVVARVNSLADLAGLLEASSLEAGHARAIVTAAPTATGYSDLPSAIDECRRVGDLMASRGYDVPPIEPGRLTAKFYRDRLSFIDVLHIAAHGEARVDTEWLVLPDDERLVVDDLLSVETATMPFVYLSTCNLGKTRYLGGGIRRGLAYTFVDRGAPAVVSNTTPVLDSASSRLAVEFYQAAATHPAGEALRIARGRSETSPATWGRAILYGNPWHRLPLCEVA